MATRTITREKNYSLITSRPKKDTRLHSWNEVHAFQQDNPFIINGYRPLTQSYRESCASLFDIHNQTVNIWSHLIGSVLYVGAGVYLWHALASKYETFAFGDIVTFGCYFVSVVACLGLSVGFHLFANHSHEIHNRHLFLDFLGILGLILGSWIPGIYYAFYCDERNAQFYWSMIGTITAACAAVISIPSCRQPHWRLVRTSLFIGLGLAGIMPMFYAARTFGIDQASRQMGWGYFCLEGLFYFTGVCLYATKVPERFWPGRFDIIGASHQIFHVMVLCGAAAHLMGIVKAFDYNHSPETRLCDLLPSA